MNDFNPKNKRYIMIKNMSDKDSIFYTGDHVGYVFVMRNGIEHHNDKNYYLFSIFPETGICVNVHDDNLLKEHFLPCPQVHDCKCYEVPEEGSDKMEKCKWVSEVEGYACCFFNSRCRPQDMVMGHKNWQKTNK